MSEGNEYQGAVIPMVTPFTENGRIDEPAARRMTEYLVENGTSPFIFGTTGESASVSARARATFVKAVVEQVHRGTIVYAGISDNCLEVSIELAKKYFDLGVDVFVVHLPSYYPLTEYHILVYYETLADRVPGPLMIYNITVTTHISIPLHVVEKLSYHPHIIGLKDSERDENRLRESAGLWTKRPDFSLFCGWGAQMMDALKLGFDGLVPSTGNLVPRMYLDLFEAVLSGNLELANSLQKNVDAISRIYQRNRLLSQSIPALKTMMSLLGLCEPYVLLPLTRTTPEDEARIRKSMQELALL